MWVRRLFRGSIAFRNPHLGAWLDMKPQIGGRASTWAAASATAPERGSADRRLRRPFGRIVSTPEDDWSTDEDSRPTYRSVLRRGDDGSATARALLLTGNNHRHGGVVRCARPSTTVTCRSTSSAARTS